MDEKLKFMENHAIVLGYGDVGRRVAKQMSRAELDFTVVDSDEGVFLDADFPFLVGNATSESILIKAGVERASTIVVTLADDAHIIFAILVSRKLNPGIVILSRANETQSIDKMYKAGADYVASLSIISGQMLGRIAVTHDKHPLREETIMMYEGIEIEKYTVSSSSPMVGKNLIELDLRNTIGCTVIGIHEGDETRSEIDPTTVILEGMTLAVLGSVEQIEGFRENFVK